LQRYDVFSTDDFAFNIYQGYDLLADDDLKDTLKGGGKTTSFDIMTIINRIGTIRKKIQEFDILYKENKCLQREHSKIGLNPVFNKATGKYIYRMQE